MTNGKKGGGRYVALFCLIGVLFFGILIYVYLLSEKARPVLLDEQGRVIEKR